MANDKKVSLSYIRLLSLGPGQVGKSTFLYRLMGLMKGNIATASLKTQPQCSTGIAEMREAFITYNSRIGALTDNDEGWQLFDKSSDLQNQMSGLMQLLVDQTQTKAVETQSPQLENDSNPTVGVSTINSIEESNANISGKLKTHSQITQEESFDKEDLTEHFTEAASSSLPSTVPSTVAFNRQESNIEEVISEFEKIKTSCVIGTNKTKFRLLLNIADVGGQPAFLEILPSLTIGPALYLVFMSLLQGLKTRYEVAYKPSNEKGLVLCRDYTYTSEEVIFRSLSSIACFGHSDKEVEAYVTKEGESKRQTSLALLVGTFADKVKREDMDDIDRELEKHLQETDFYKDGLIYDKKFLKVNNMGADEKEITKQRELLETIIQNKIPKYEIPTRWLTLSICLKLLARKEGKHEVSFVDCVKLGKRFEMDEKMVRVALQFLHKYIGLVMYFPQHPHLKDVVICDPQVVFSSISELIFNIYDPNKFHVTVAQHDHFVRTGCFFPEEITSIDERQFKSRNLLSIKTLIDLLVLLNIAAEVPSNLGLKLASAKEGETDSPKSKLALEDMPATDNAMSKKCYFLPAVLQTAESKLLVRGANEEHLPEPLCIRFKTGYLPLGFVCALSANLLAESEFKLIPIQHGEHLITYKNKMKFRYKGEIDIIMISGPKYCEFRVSSCSETINFQDRDRCLLIRITICKAADRVIKSLKHGSLYQLSKGYELAFKCPHHPKAEIGHEPLAHFNSMTLTTPEQIQCVDLLCHRSTSLTKQMEMWFEKGQPPRITVKPTRKDKKIKVKAEGTEPLMYQWLKNDQKLSDDIDYRGSTTPELEIVGTDSQHGGCFKCQVENAHGKTCSANIEYNPFKEALMHKGLKSGEISTLISNGFESLSDIKSLTEDELNEMPLNLGEKIRVRKLIDSLNMPPPSSPYSPSGDGFESLSDIKSLTEDELNERPLNLGEKIRVRKLFDSLNMPPPSSPHTGSLFDVLKTALWDIRVHWYLLGIQLESDHSILEDIRKRNFDKDTSDKCFLAVLNGFLTGKGSRDVLIAALKSPPLERDDLIQRIPYFSKVSGNQPHPTGLSASEKRAFVLKELVNALWEVRANWKSIAESDTLIPYGTCETIERDYPNSGERLAAFLHEHLLKGEQDPNFKKLVQCLRDVSVGRDDIANDLEKKIEAMLSTPSHYAELQS